MSHLNDKIDILEDIMSMVPCNIFWQDINGVFLGCNHSHAALAGFDSPHQIVGKTNFDLPWKEQAKELNQINSQVITSGKEYVIEESGFLADDREAIFLSRKSPLRDRNGKIIGIVGISFDITLQKQAEKREKVALAEAAAANARAQAEEEFRQAVMILSGSVAHDFRTPLAILRMIMEGINRDLPKLLEGCLAAQVAELPLENEFDERDIQILEKRLHDGVSTIQELNDIIDNNLKTLSRSTLKELAMGDLVKCSSYHCLHNALTRYPLAEHQRDLIKHDGSYYFDFMGNELLMIRVLTNLIKNSLEQIDENKKGDIKIWSQKHDNKNTLHIHDTAGGCAPEFLDKLFSGFHTTKKGGTGIGLAFCKKTLHSFGADIVCHSVYGESMEFVLAFPKV